MDKPEQDKEQLPEIAESGDLTDDALGVVSGGGPGRVINFTLN
ncbi:MAG: hypothetical protein WCP28_13355 [Actinomycetes bacterium]